MPPRPRPSGFDEQVRALIRPAASLYLHPLRRGETCAAATTRFGGRPYAEAGEAWPLCGGCGRGLHFIFQCNLAECPAEVSADLHGAGLVTFFYCFDCSPWGMDADAPDAWAVRRYTSPSDARDSPLADASPEEGRVVPCAVRLQAVASLPDWEGLEVVAPEVSLAFAAADGDPWRAYQDAVDRALGEARDGDSQIGGSPRFVQGDETPFCTACNARMRLLAQLDSELDADIMWGDAGCVYLFECPDHPGLV